MSSPISDTIAILKIPPPIMKELKPYIHVIEKEMEVKRPTSAIRKKVKLQKDQLYVLCEPDVKATDLKSLINEKGYTLMIEPYVRNDLTVSEWVQYQEYGIGSYKNGNTYEQIRNLDVLTGADVRITTGFDGLTNFASSINLNALLTGSQGTLGRLEGVSFKVQKVPESIMAINYRISDLGALQEALEKIVATKVKPTHMYFTVEGSTTRLALVFMGLRERNHRYIEHFHELVMDMVTSIVPKDKAMDLWEQRYLSRLVDESRDIRTMKAWIVPTSSSTKIIKSIRDTLLPVGHTALIYGVVVDRSTVHLTLLTDMAIEKEEGVVLSELDTMVLQMGGKVLGHIDDWVSHTRELHGNGFPRLCGLVKKAVDPFETIEVENPPMEVLDAIEERKPFGLNNWLPKRMKEVMTKEHYRDIRALVGRENTSRDRFERILYSHDLAPLPSMVGIGFDMVPDIVVRPQDVGSLAKLVAYCYKYRIPITPKGAGSWAFAGCVPSQGGVLLDLMALNAIEIDEDTFTAICGPGARIEAIGKKAERSGLMIGAYPGSAPSATIGGWVAVNGAGIGSYKYGNAFEQVVDLEIITPNGKIIDTRFRKIRSRSLYDLPSLYCGTEGTFGIITKVVMKLHPLYDEIKPLTYSFASDYDLARPLSALRKAPFTPFHMSFQGKRHFFYLNKLDPAHPVHDGAVINVVLEGQNEDVAEEEDLLDALMLKFNGKKMPMEFSTQEWSQRFYRMRSRRLGPGGGLGEVVIPIGRFKEMVEALGPIVSDLKMQVALDGEVLDRNSIAFMPYYISDETKTLKLMATMGFMKRLADAGIRLSGRPVGVGLWFASNLDKMHGPTGAALVRDLKVSLDPRDILNPGKHTEIRTRFGVAMPQFGMDLALDILGMIKHRMSRDRIESVVSGRKKTKGRRK